MYSTTAGGVGTHTTSLPGMPITGSKAYSLAGAGFSAPEAAAASAHNTHVAAQRPNRRFMSLDPDRGTGTAVRRYAEAGSTERTALPVPGGRRL